MFIPTDISLDYERQNELEKLSKVQGFKIILINDKQFECN